MPGRGDSVAEAEEAIGREEELGDRPVGAGIDLALQIIEVGALVRAVGMGFGISGHRNVERSDLLQARDQLGGIGVAARMRLIFRARLGRIAAKRDQVANPDLPIIAGDLVDLLARRADAGQMRGRGQLGFLDDPLDGGVGALAGRTAGAVGHRHEARMQRSERLDRLPQRRRHRVALRRKEFEAHVDIAARFGEQRHRIGHAARRWRWRAPALGPAPQGHGQLAAFEMLDMVGREPGGGEPRRHHLVLETKPDVRVAGAQVLALVRREIGHQQGSAGRKHPRRLGDRRRRRMGVVQHLVDDDAVGAAVGQRKRVHVALAQARQDARRFQLDPRQPQHFRGAVDPDRLLGARPEQLDHSAGAGADIDQPPERPVAERALHRLLDFAFGDVERADRVPHFGVGGEITGRGFGAVGADGVEPRRVGLEQGLGRLVGPAIEQSEHRVGPLGLGKRQEHPAAFLAPFDHPGIGEDLEMARHPRLALGENLGEFADRQFHPPQKREDPQPGRVRKRLEQVGKGKDRRHGIRI